MFHKHLRVLFLFLVSALSVHAQDETIITGHVTEIGSNVGVPFANVYFKGTFIGTVTDFDGKYSIKTVAPKDSIFVSIIGYKSKTKAVKKGKTQVIDFQIGQESISLNTVVIRPGINPALRIINNAIEKKNKYTRENLNSVQFVSYTKQQADIDNITPRMRKRKFLNSITNLWDKLDTLAGDESKANLPVMMSEIMSEIYYTKDGKYKREDVNAIKIKFVGMKDGSAISQLTGTDFQSYNFYNNNVAILEKDFLSPLADNALQFYNYILADSLWVDNYWCYKIDCHPKNKKDLAYTGTLWITDTTFAIKQLDLEITPEVNFNLVDRARIQQVMIPTEAGPWVPMQTRVLIDYTNVTKKLVSLIVRTYNYNQYYVVNQPKEKDFYNTRITFAEDALLKDSTYWAGKRPEQLTPLENESYKMIDTVRALPLVKNMVNVLYFLITGYKDIGPIDLGPYYSIYSYNNYEGQKFRLGFRTNEKFSKNWIIRGYGAYGVRDKGFKYSLQLERIITRFPWSKAGVQYRNDIDLIGTSYNLNNTINLGQSPNTLNNTFSQIGNISKLVRKQESRIWYEKEFNNGLSGKLTFQNILTTPLFPVLLADQFNIFQTRKFSITEALLDVRYSVKERFVQNGTERISFGNNKSPVITLNYTLGIQGLLNGDFNYHKVSLSFSNRFRFATWGYSQVYLKGGKVFSKIPYILLEIPRGNQTLFWGSNLFNQMNNFEFVTDQFVQAFWQHHFNGLLFNRIPLLKKLNLREILGINATYGTLSAKNKSFNSNNYFTIPDKEPYLEADVGIENLIDVLRVDFLYRLTYNSANYKTQYELNNPGNKISNWGIKVGFHFSF